MGSFRLIARKIPLGATDIRFMRKDGGDFGMINLGNWRRECEELTNCHHVVIHTKEINLHFPLDGAFYYVKKYRSRSGFTMRRLLSRIYHIAGVSGMYHAEMHPEHFAGPITRPEDFVGEWAVTSTSRDSDIKIDGDNVYVAVQH